MLFRGGKIKLMVLLASSASAKDKISSQSGSFSAGQPRGSRHLRAPKTPILLMCNAGADDILTKPTDCIFPAGEASL